MAQGAGAYNKLTKVDNPVVDSFRYWGGTIGKRNDALLKENQERRTTLANQYREWTKTNGVNDEMFKSMITENVNFDTQYYNAAIQTKEAYLEALREGTDNYWDISKRNQSERKMKTILSNFKDLETVGSVISDKIKKIPELMKDPNYDRDLNGDFEDIAMAIVGNKNFQIGFNKDNLQQEVWYPSSDGSLKKITLPALTSGNLLDAYMRVDGNKMSKDIINTVAHKVETSLSGLMEVKEDKWYEQGQKFYEEAFKSKLDDRTMASLFKDNVDRNSRKTSGFTDEEREQVWNVFKDRGDVFFKESYSKKYNKEAVSIRNTDANNAEKRYATNSRAQIARGQLGLGYAKLALSEEELNLKKDIYETKNSTFLTPMETTKDKGATKKGTKYINIGLPKEMTIPSNRTYKVNTITDGKMVNGKVVGGKVKQETKAYGDIKVRGFNAVKGSDGTWKFAAEFNNSTIPYTNPSAIAAQAGYKSVDEMYRALDAAEYDSAKSKK